MDVQDVKDWVYGWDGGDFSEIPLISAHFRSFEQGVGVGCGGKWWRFGGFGGDIGGFGGRLRGFGEGRLGFRCLDVGIGMAGGMAAGQI